MPGAQASAAADQACADRCRHEPATKTGPLLQALLQDQEVTPGGSKTVTCVSAGHRFVSPAKDWWPGAGSNRRPSAFQGCRFAQVRGPAGGVCASRVPHQCFTTIDLGSFAESPCRASSDSAVAISL